MMRRIPAPTEEQLAEAEAEVDRRRVEREFEENRQALEARRPRGAAKLSRTRAFGASAPPLNRGPMEYEPDPQPTNEAPDGQHRLSAFERASLAGPSPLSTPLKKKKSRFDVTLGPDGEPIRTSSTVIKALGVLYVEERKADPIKAYQNLRDSIMINLDVLLPAMPQIKQMFELLQIGEPERKKDQENGKADKIETLTGGLRRFLQGDDE
jgi:hypothetical protein